MIGTLRYIRRQLAADAAYWQLSRKWRRLSQDHPLDPDEIGLIIREGIGDHFAVAAFAEALSTVHHCRIRICGNPRYAFLRELFPAVSTYFPLVNTAELDPVADRTVRPGHYSLAFFAADYSLAKALGYGGFHMLDAYRCHFGLGPQVKPSIPAQPTLAQQEEASHYLAARGLPAGRTVLLCTDARSISTASITTAFWTQLAGDLVRRGLSPAINRGPSTTALPGVPLLDLTLEQFRATATVAGAVCAVRSGLVDLAADLPALRVVLYPRITHNSGNLVDAFTLRGFGYPTSVREFTVADDAADHIPAILEALT